MKIGHSSLRIDGGSILSRRFGIRVGGTTRIKMTLNRIEHGAFKLTGVNQRHDLSCFASTDDFCLHAQVPTFRMNAL